MTTRIYLDHTATTPLDPDVARAMDPWLGGRFGNPASPHHVFGWDAEKALELARAEVADLVHAEPREIVFTSGGTEADNLAVLGRVRARGAGERVVVSAVENRAVHDAARALEKQGVPVTFVGVDSVGRVDLAALERALDGEVALVSVQVANAEVGTLQDVEAVGHLAAARGVTFHADATQAAAWVELDVRRMGVHLLSLSAHRMHGPMGVGALYVRRRPRVRLAPLLYGGGQEGGLRAGAPNLPGAVGMGRAAEICRERRADDARRVSTLRDRLEDGIANAAPGVAVLGDVRHRLPNVSALSVEGVEGEALVLAVPSVAMATGSACASAGLEPSYVLAAMGLPKRTADQSVRFGLGRFTTEAEVDEARRVVVEAIARIRRTGPNGA